MRRHATTQRATTLACLVCGLLLIPTDLPARDLPEARRQALLHAQQHTETDRTLNAQVNYWRTYCATGGR